MNITKKKVNEVETDPSKVWEGVSRIEFLSDQIDIGISTAAELSACAHAASQAKAYYAKDVAKSVKKKAKQVEKVCSSLKTSEMMSIMMMKEAMLAHGVQMEEDSKAIETDVAHALTTIHQDHVKEKQKFDQELHDRIKALKQAKFQVKKERKECQKWWDVLQTEMTRLNEGRSEILGESDPKKQAKIEKKISKAIKAITKSRDTIAKHFFDLEASVRQTNLFQTAHHMNYCPDLVVRMKNSDVQRSKSVTTALKRYIEIQQESCRKLTNLLDHLEKTVNQIDAESDASNFMKMDIPAGKEYPPDEIVTGLPCPSVEVNTVIDKILDGSYPGIQLPDFGSAFGRNTAVSSSTRDVFNDSGSSFRSSVQPSQGPSPPGHPRPPTDSAPSPIPPAPELSPRIPPPPPPPPPARAMSVTKAVALYDLEGTPDNLALSEGDVLIVTDQSDDTWWGGYLEKDSGREENWFPREYVDLL